MWVCVGLSGSDPFERSVTVTVGSVWVCPGLSGSAPLKDRVQLQQVVDEMTHQHFGARCVFVERPVGILEYVTRSAIGQRLR